MLCTHWDLRTALVQRRKQAQGFCHLGTGRIRTEANLVPKPTNEFSLDGEGSKEGSRRDLSATPG